jgi:hypothetical protein
VVANGASMQMVEGSIPTAPRSSYNGSCSDHGLEGNLVKLTGTPFEAQLWSRSVSSGGRDLCAGTERPLSSAG